MQSQTNIPYTRKLPALEELQARPQWVCWRKEQRQGTFTKVPYSARTGNRAGSDNPATWASYGQAVQALRAGTYHGIGYVFHQDYTGIDLDHCVNPDGSIDAWAQAYLDRLGSYAEYSPSKTGVHILVRGAVPRGIRRRIQDAPHPQAAIEMYCEKRYFTVTGQHLTSTPTTIETCVDLQAIHAELTVPGPAPQPASNERPDELSDTALLDRAMSAKNGATFRALWHGTTTGYVSQSEAELALCTLLAFWTGKDASRMDRLFRRSALYREKWDRPARSGETYGQGTISRAIANCAETYSPQVGGKIIRFRRRRAAPDDTQEVELPETDVQFILDCLRDEEEGDARLYAHLFRGRCIYDHTEKMWYEWRGNFWERDECKHALLLASGPLASAYLDTSAQLSDEAAQAEKQLDPDLLKNPHADDPRLQRYEWLKAKTGELIGRAKALKKLQRVQAILTYAQAYLKITSREWDTNPWLLACPNGVLDLRTGELHHGNPADHIKTAIPTEWTGLDTPAPRWEQFLQEMFQNKPEQERHDLLAFLQRLFGYGLTGSTVHHLFTLFFGIEGRNGKDTLFELLKEVLGPLVGVVSTDVFISQDRFRAGGAPTPHLVDLQGKRMAWGSETRQSDKLNIAQIKLLTGGGDISARQLHGRQYSFTPTHKLFLMTNYKPHADARDKAFWSRACLIELGIRFVEHPQAPNERKADMHLKDALRQERSGILTWLVRGCLAWQQQEGLAIPPSVHIATEKYRDEEDKVLQFLNECCVMNAIAHVKASALYEAYKDWCKENQFGSVNATLFGNEISKRFEKKRTNAGMTYQGVGIRASGEFPEEGPETPDDAGVGLVYTPQDAPNDHKEASEDNPQPSESNGRVGCVGFYHVFSFPENESSSRGKYRGKPYTPYTSSTIVNTSQPASEVNARANDVSAQPYTNPTRAQPVARAAEIPEPGTNSLLRPVRIVQEDGEMKPNPKLVHHLVETPDGLGYLTGGIREQDVTFTAPERKEQLRYKVGVALVPDGVERFYLPATVWEIEPQETQPEEQR